MLKLKKYLECETSLFRFIKIDISKVISCLLEENYDDIYNSVNCQWVYTRNRNFNYVYDTH